MYKQTLKHYNDYCYKILFILFSGHPGTTVQEGVRVITGLLLIISTLDAVRPNNIWIYLKTMMRSRTSLLKKKRKKTI